MTVSVSPTQAREILAINLQADLVTMMKGSPSTAKSAIVKDLAEEYNMKLIDLRLAQCDPTDLLGFPFIDEKAGRAKYVPMNTFPIVGDELPLLPGEAEKAANDSNYTPLTYNGWLLFLDEMNSADRGVQKASYKLLLDREVGEFSLHPNVRIVAAGNLDTDGAIVEEMSSAIKSRICHLNVHPDNASWLTWARGPGQIDFRVTSFIEFKPQNLYTFDPEKSEAEDTYACYRTWEFANRQLEHIPDVSKEKNALAVFTSSLGEGVAREFLAFLRMFGKLPKFAKVVSDPTGTPVPTEPGHQFAMSGTLGQNAEAANITPVMTYINRLPMEFQVITLREMLRRTETLLQTPPVQVWVKANGKELYQ